MTLQSGAAQAARPAYPRFLDAGETALVVEFGDTVDPAINAQVLALDYGRDPLQFGKRVPLGEA